MTKTILSSWNDVKKALDTFERAGFLKTLHDLYQLNKGNQDFFHARFLQGPDTLGKYKQRIYKNLFPKFEHNKSVSISEAKRAVAEYRKAVGRPEEMLELHVFWCETAADFTMEYGYADEGYFDALIRQFECALKLFVHMEDNIRLSLGNRLIKVRDKTDCGYGVQDDMDHLLREYGVRA